MNRIQSNNITLNGDDMNGKLQFELYNIMATNRAIQN